jgi:predicted metalloprotease with PDZ domain
VRHPRKSTLGNLLLGIAFAAAGAPRLPAVTPVTCSSPSSTQTQPTEYFVSLADNARNLAHVSIRFPQIRGTVALNMPVWNALYQIRDFAANLEHVRAFDDSGRPVPLVKRNTSEWEMTPPGGCVVVDYDVHLDAGGPFGAQLNAEHGFFNWAMMLMYSPATRAQNLSLQMLDVPAGWGLGDIHVIGAAPAGMVEKAVGVAHGYDELADSPAEVGTFQHFDFQQDGATYHIVVHADPKDYDTAKLEDIVRRVTHAAVDWMADRPFTEYTFLYHFPRGHGAGGMEHAYGTAIDLNSERLGSNMMSVASVSAHEFFHLWNVKRIRPQSLEPIDYQHAMDTLALWFSEGVTSTVGDMLLARAGLLDDRQYIDRVASEINELQSRPARSWQSVEESSLDAWFEGSAFYRSPQRSISYYNKGEVLGVLLDLRMRQLTHGRKSLRDLFQWMNDNYAKKGLFFPDSDGVQQAAEAITGQSFAEFFQEYVAGVRELPYSEYFNFVGLRVAETTIHTVISGFTATTYMGGQPEVTSVDPGSEAERASVAIGDRVIEVNGNPATAPVEDQFARMREGATVKIRLANRRGRRDIKLKLTSRNEQVYILQDVPSITPQQRAHREAWIHGDDETGGEP